MKRVYSELALRYVLSMGLDGVEMILSVEEEFGIIVSDGDAESMMTVRDMIESVCSKLDLCSDSDADLLSESAGVTHCISQRAFYKIRTEITQTTGVDRGLVRLETKIKDLFPKCKGAGQWKQFVSRLGIWGKTVPWHGSWWSGHIAPRTVKDMVTELVEQNPAYLSVYGKWSRGTVRERVRAIVSEQLDVRDFDDDAEFVRDLGMM